MIWVRFNAAVKRAPHGRVPVLQNGGTSKPVAVPAAGQNADVLPRREKIGFVLSKLAHSARVQRRIGAASRVRRAVKRPF